MTGILTTDISDQYPIFHISLNQKKPKEEDYQMIRLMNPVLETYLPPLTYITTLSFTEGAFPFELKIAQVLPLYKNNEPMLFNNYRPNINPSILFQIIWETRVQQTDRFH